MASPVLNGPNVFNVSAKSTSYQTVRDVTNERVFDTTITKAWFTRNVFYTVFLTVLKWAEWISTVMFTQDVTKCKNKIKGAADKNGLKNVTYKPGRTDSFSRKPWVGQSPLPVVHRYKVSFISPV